MLKRYLLASIVAGLALGAHSAAAGDLWFYEGHGWLPQPPLSWTTGQGHGSTVIAGPTSALAGAQSTDAMTPSGNASPRINVPAPYDRSGFDAGFFDYD